MARSIADMEPGDYIKDIDGVYHEIRSIWGIVHYSLPSEYTVSEPPSRGGFGVTVEEGRGIDMWHIAGYYKKGDPRP